MPETLFQMTQSSVLEGQKLKQGVKQKQANIGHPQFTGDRPQKLDWAGKKKRLISYRFQSTCSKLHVF